MRVSSRIAATFVLLAGAATLALAACGTSAGPATDVKLALDWIPNTNHTGIYVAQQQGYYRQHGINVALMPYGSTAPEALVASGQVQFAVSFQEYVTINRAAGQPLVAVAAIIAHNTSGMAVLANSGITRPAQLQGKRFASAGDPAEDAVIATMLAHDGVAHPSYQPIQVQDASHTSLVSKAADFVWIYNGVEGVQAKDEGVNLTTFNPTDYGVPDFYSPVLITSQQEITQHPDVVRAMVQATAQGYSYAAQHPHESADLLLQHAGGTLFANPQQAYDSQAFQSAHYSDKLACWGQQSGATWANFGHFLYGAGVLVDANNKPLTSEPDYTAMFTNQFLASCS
ncbi:MAG: ABC transporter substrate-binding protein [Ktedonobacterales bacterium]|nr:ABC transporter substrate-binding protein [Ktedonobacterales bacterium]